MSSIVKFMKIDNPKRKKSFNMNDVSEFDLRTYGWVRDTSPDKLKTEPKAPVKEQVKEKETDTSSDDNSEDVELPTIKSEAPKKPGRKPATKKTDN